MKVKSCEKLKKHQTMLLTILVALIGMIVFVCIYGFDVLDVTNEDWLYNAEDLTQHYYGWVFYRNADWTFPIGLFDTLSYPEYGSIVFTDSIPLFAIIFKTISGILPETFQYFGLFGLICYMLQGVFAFTLLRKFIKNKLLAVIGAVFFILSPCIIQRMFIHTALSANFLLLIALCLFAYRDKYKEKPKRKIIWWSLLLMLCVSIHLYYIPIVVIIMLATFVSEYIEDKKSWKTSTLTFVISCILGILLIYILGGFYNTNYINDGTNYFNANLNIFINPQGYSTFLPRLAMATDGEFEAFGYLGFGMILMGIAGIILIFIKRDKQELKRIIKRPNTIAILICIALGMILSMGSSVKIGGHILFNIPYPNIIMHLLSIFRATGRFIILPYYLIFLVCIYVINKYISKKYAIILITICLLVQIADIYPAMVNRIKYRQSDYEYDKTSWEQALKGYEHIVYLSNPYYSKIDTFRLAKIASENNCTLNDFYFARKLKGVEENTKKILEDLKDGKIEEDTIYVIRTDDLKEEKKPNLFYYNIDKFTIITSSLRFGILQI